MGAPKKKASSRRVIEDYEKAPGAPISDEDAKVIGEELRRIADAHHIDGVRSLTPEIILQEVEQDPEHPFRKYLYSHDDATQARMWRLHQCRKMVHWVRVVQVDLPKVVPRYVSVSRQDLERNGVRRADAVSRLVDKNDVASHKAYERAVAEGMVRRLEQAFNALERYVTEFALGAKYTRLVNDVRTALTVFRK
jgi:hypothetical protein